MPRRQFSRPDLTKYEKEAEALQLTLQYLNNNQKAILRRYVTKSTESRTKRLRKLGLLLSFAGIDSRWAQRALYRHFLT